MILLINQCLNFISYFPVNIYFYFCPFQLISVFVLCFSFFYKQLCPCLSMSLDLPHFSSLFQKLACDRTFGISLPIVLSMWLVLLLKLTSAECRLHWQPQTAGASPATCCCCSHRRTQASSRFKVYSLCSSTQHCRCPSSLVCC